MIVLAGPGQSIKLGGMKQLGMISALMIWILSSARPAEKPAEPPLIDPLNLNQRMKATFEIKKREQALAINAAAV